MNRPIAIVPLALALVLTPCGAQTDPLANLHPEHPRLLLRADGWAELRARRQSDPDFARLIDRIHADARMFLDRPPLKHEKRGRRLLHVSREALQRMLLWGVSHRLTGDDAFARRAEQELLNLAAFPDWNPSHFLDTAEMTAALALGYDWLFDNLSPETRAKVRQAILDKGIHPGLEVCGRKSGWHRRDNNWNQVCFGGLTLGALAIADESPEPARRLLEAAREGIPYGLRAYAPDGIYPEGPGYWNYGTVYQVLMISGLRSALGTDWNLPASPGFQPSAGVQLALTGPTGEFYNYFDSGSSAGLQPALYWFARELKDPALLRFQQQPLEATLRSADKPARDSLFALLAIWWSGMPDASATPKVPLNWHGQGDNPLGVFRTSWSDPDALYLAFKGGAATLNHGHMDAGSFILESDGVRWAIDVGRQDYLSLESKGVDLWNSSQNSARWKVFRLNNFSHNTLTIDGKLHVASGNARITDFAAEPTPHAVIDLTPVFKGQAERVTRRFELGPDRTVLIRDELRGLRPAAPVRWALVTRAQVELAGPVATLRQKGKSLPARVISPADLAFEVIPADPPEDDFNAPNPDTRILILNTVAPASGELQIEVTLQPRARQ